MQSDVRTQDLPLSIKVVLWLHVVYLALSVLRSYFGGFQERWRDHNGAVGMSSSRVGHIALFIGEMQVGSKNMILLWVLLPMISSQRVNIFCVDIIFVSHAAWLGVRLAVMCPWPLLVTSLVLEPRGWLTVGFLYTAWGFASWHSKFMVVACSFYGIYVNNFKFPQKVFGVSSTCACCSMEWNYEAYKEVISRVRVRAGPKNACQYFRHLFLTHLDREQVVVELFDMHRAERWGSICCFLFCAAVFILPIAFVMIIVRTSAITRQNWKGAPGICAQDTRVRCNYFLDCDSYRNASCDRREWTWTGHCICPPNLCAVDGVCVSDPTWWKNGNSAETKTHAVTSKGALVFSGGGAKGAWAVGILQGLCERSAASSGSFSNWSLLVGTSIGALNAGFLAQFPPDLQCAVGVPAMAKYWQGITSAEDIFQSPSHYHWQDYDHTQCFKATEWPATVDAFQTRGGLCDPSPGSKMYAFEVNPERIRTSGMGLRVLATSLNRSRGVWWNESSPDIVEGTQASGAIAPLLFPKVIDGEWYIDGGFIANTPVYKAVQEGAEEILVLLLDPLEVPRLASWTDFGSSVLEFELDLLMFKYFYETELQKACSGIARVHGKIWGYAPNVSVGSLIDFNRASIERMRKSGHERALSADPVDLCAWLKAHLKESNVPESAHNASAGPAQTDAQRPPPKRSPLVGLATEAVGLNATTIDMDCLGLLVVLVTTFTSGIILGRVSSPQGFSDPRRQPSSNLDAALLKAVGDDRTRY